MVPPVVTVPFSILCQALTHVRRGLAPESGMEHRRGLVVLPIYSVTKAEHTISVYGSWRADDLHYLAECG